MVEGRRTPLQRRGNDFDQKVFMLTRAAEQNADTIDAKEKAIWQEALIYLARCRTIVRTLMHPDDRKATEP